MEKVQIDFLRKKHRLAEPRRKPFSLLSRLLLIAVVFSIVGASALSYQIASSGEGDTNFPNLSLFSTLRGLVQAGDRELAGEGDDRINLLLMGIGGEGHSGPQLTDTMIFASYQPSTQQMGMISIPRDLTVPIPGHGWQKINHANAYGETDEPGAGPNLAANVVEEILQQDIHDYLRVDFDGFAKFINDIDGLDIYVDRAFTDYEYPSHGMENADCDSASTTDINYDCRFEVLSFQEGWIHMDGDTALKYVRSRHGTNGEASDFARSRRQQKVLAAVKEKTFSVSTILNPNRIAKIIETLSDHIATNLNTWELIRLGNQLKDLDASQIANHVLDTAPDSPLYATSLNGAYVILPKNDDWRPLQVLAANVFTPDSETMNIFAQAGEDKPRFVKVEIQNGTDLTGLAFSTSQLLDGQGFEVVKIGNAEARNYQHTVIYDLTNGERPEELKALRDFLKADVTLSATGWLVNGDIVPKELVLTTDDFQDIATEESIDFLIILGENSANLVRR
ncbi:LCP family protein [Patescibacteria group bacterium]|nr:LCP family protein [Patescibacteria group bacterium]